MNEHWPTKKEVKNSTLIDTLKALSAKTNEWDAQVGLIHRHLVFKLIELDSFEALEAWMKSNDPEAAALRDYIEKTGHRTVIGVLWRRLKATDIELLKSYIL